MPPIVGVWTGRRTKAVPIDELAPEQIDEDLLEDLHYYATGETTGPFVIPETERVKVYLTGHGGQSE